jgi:prolactin regulatory element-binding protein
MLNTTLTLPQPVMTILKAHDFPVTSLKFNPSGTLVISGSADNTVRVITIPADARSRFCTETFVSSRS